MKYSKEFDLRLHGRYHYRWAVMPHSKKTSASELTALANSWKEQMLGVIVPGSTGKMKQEKCYLAIDKSVIPVSVERRKREIDALVFEADGKSAAVKVKNGFAGTKPETVQLDGRKVKSLGPHKIGWVRIKKRK